MQSTFEPDLKIQKIAEAYAQHAVVFAAEHFKLALDWSDGSIIHVETILDSLHKQAEKDKPTVERVFHIAKTIGSYIGEVYRRNHGATWGIVVLNGERFPGLKADLTGETCWPWGRADKRIRNGEEDNVWHYYQLLVQKGDPSRAAPMRW